MDLSIIIVNWNSREYLRKCIASVVTHTHGLHYEIIVIDSASYDGCGQMLREHYPQVQFIQSERNLGFAGSNNEAYSRSTGEVLLFLNPDTELRGAAINLLYEQLRTLPQPGAIGGMLLNSDGSIQTSCVQSFPTILNQTLNTAALRRWLPHSSLWGTSVLFEKHIQAAEVDVISGACIMITRSAFEEVGKFSPEYFMFSEDVDLCFKTRQFNKINYYVPTATVIHHGGTSSQKQEVSTFSSVMMFESRWRYFCRTRSPIYGSLYRISMFGVSLSRMIVAFAFWLPNFANPKGQRWKSVLTKWKARFRWTLGFERWVSEFAT